jgi:glycerophosphoryl diester phosphodiesterase
MDWETPGRGLRVGGHRGARGDAPENTYAAFEVGAVAGADYLELDIQLTLDRVLVVFHDEELDRTSDGHGPLAELTAAELARLDAGSWHGSRYAGQRIPGLADVLVWIAARPGLGATLEAKGPGTGRPIAAMLRNHRLRSRLSICSFSPAELRGAASIAPGVPRMLIVDRDERGADLIVAARDASASWVNVPWDWLDADALARLHAAGLQVAGGTLNDPEMVPSCLAIGLDAVDSDHPARIVAAVRAAI